MRDAELLVRYFAYQYFLPSYNGNLKTFLDGNKSWVGKANIFLESLATSSDDKLKELLMFGFLEYANPNEDYYSNIVGAFGSRTKVLLKETIEHNKMLAKSQK